MITSSPYITTRFCGISCILIASLNYLIALCQIKKEESLYTVKTDHILSVCIVGENIYNNTCTLFAKISLWNKGWGDKSYWYLLIGWWLILLNCLSCAMSACNFWFFLFWIAKCSNQKIWNLQIYCSDSKLKKIPFLFFPFIHLFIFLLIFITSHNRDYRIQICSFWPSVYFKAELDP